MAKDSIKLHLGNSSGLLDQQEDKIRRAFDKASDTCTHLLKLGRVDVMCWADPRAVIPETGVGGYTPNRHLIQWTVDSSKDLDAGELYYTLCHEMNHARRYDGEGYGKTLFDSMVFEGLATCFEGEVSGGKAMLYKYVTSHPDPKDLVTKYFLKHMDSTDFMYRDWFIRDPTELRPRWAGYIAGTYVIAEYMAAKNKTAPELVLEASHDIREFVRDTLG